MPWKPGESGNPNGEWNGRPFRDALRRALARAAQKDDYRQLNALADKLIDKAAEGDMAAMKELADRIDGKVTQQLEIEAGSNLLGVLANVGSAKPGNSDDPPLA